MELTFSKVEGLYADKLEKIFGVEGGGMIEVNPGRVLVPPKFEDIAQRILNLEVRPDDVWLISYPRTGKSNNCH
jgi:phage major head subunit gpT-like protein